MDVQKPKVTPDFCFAFSDGVRWQEQMSREDLLIVIQTLLIERNEARKDRRDALVRSKDLVLT